MARTYGDMAHWPIMAEPRGLGVHVGDYVYREVPCPTDAESLCGGSPYGDNYATWDADFFTVCHCGRDEHSRIVYAVTFQDCGFCCFINWQLGNTDATACRLGSQCHLLCGRSGLQSSTSRLGKAGVAIHVL
jgi:hypothetical protein